MIICVLNYIFLLKFITNFFLIILDLFVFYTFFILNFYQYIVHLQNKKYTKNCNCSKIKTKKLIKLPDLK